MSVILSAEGEEGGTVLPRGTITPSGTIPPSTADERAVPILLECFLVVFSSKSRSFAEMMSVMQILPTSRRKFCVKFTGGVGIGGGVGEW